jgi:hypothetical protein
MNRVIGVVIVAWRFRDQRGNTKLIHCKAYHHPTADIRLWSPQSYFQEEANGGSGHIGATALTLTFSEGERLVFPYDARSNSPLATNVSVTDSSSRNFRSLPFAHVALGPRIALSVADETNQNLTAAQKELLLKHWIYGHAMMRRVQKLLRETSNLDFLGQVASKNQPVVLCKHPAASKCVPPMCAACQLAKMKIRDSQTTTSKPHVKKRNLGDGSARPGDCVAVDQFVVRVPGRLPNTTGKEKLENKFTGGIFLWISCQGLHL